MKKIYIKTICFLFILLTTCQWMIAQTQFQYLYEPESSIEVFAEPASTQNSFFMVSDSYNDTAAFFHRIIIQRLTESGGGFRTSGVFRPPSFRLGAIKSTANIGLLLMGTVNVPLVDEDSVFVIKLDDKGIIEWSKGFQIEANIHDVKGAIETIDGSYLVYGTYEHVNFAEGIFLLKIDASGTLVWSRTINSQLPGAFMKVGGVVEMVNGDLLLSGSTRFNSEGSWLAKLNNIGETQSVTFYDTHKLTQSQPEPFAIHKRLNEEVDIFYNSTGFQGGDAILLAIRADANGVPLKITRFYNGVNFGEITSIKPDGSGGYVGSGYYFPGNTNRSKGLAIKIGGDYSIKWSKGYGTDYIEILTSIFPVGGGDLFMAGFADFDSLIVSPSENGLFPWLVKTNADGETNCYDKNTVLSSKDTTFSTMAYQLDNVSGVTLGDIPFRNIPVSIPRKEVMCMAQSIETLPVNHFQLYPNPSQGEIFIETSNARIHSVELFDIFGRKLLSDFSVYPGEIEINTDYKGMAIVKVTGEDGVWSGKVMLK